MDSAGFDTSLSAELGQVLAAKNLRATEDNFLTCSLTSTFCRRFENLFEKIFAEIKSQAYQFAPPYLHRTELVGLCSLPDPPPLQRMQPYQRDTLPLS